MPKFVLFYSGKLVKAASSGEEPNARSAKLAEKDVSCALSFPTKEGTCTGANLRLSKVH